MSDFLMYCTGAGHDARSSEPGWTAGPLYILHDQTPALVDRHMRKRPLCDACARHDLARKHAAARLRSDDSGRSRADLAALAEKFKAGTITQTEMVGMQIIMARQKVTPDEAKRILDDVFRQG